MLARVPCPYCYQRIDPGRLSYQCTGRGGPGREPCTLVLDEQRLALTGYSGPSYPSFPVLRAGVGSPRRARCPACDGESGIRVCPRCHTPLSDGFGRRSPLIGMVGGKGAGKTVYLAVLWHEIHHSVRRRFDADVYLAGDQQPVGSVVASPGEWVKSYENALFDDGLLPEGTHATVDGRRTPLVITWRLPRRVLGRPRFATTQLSFYDAAGEDFITQAATHAQAYLGVASGLIVLLDPWQLPGARHAIDVPPDALERAERPMEVLTRVTEMLRAAAGASSRRRLTVPLAVVFSKMDVLYPLLDEDDPLLERPPTGPGYDEQAGLDTHERVRALLDRLHADEIDVHLRHNYRTFRYFAVSALGAPPDYAARRVDRRGVRPLRVEEPLLWLLCRFDVVDRLRT